MSKEIYMASKGIIRYKDSVLILQESNFYLCGTHRGRWDVVGGRAKGSESLIECMKREAYQETGLNIEINEIFFKDSWHPVINNIESDVNNVFFSCKTNNDKVKLNKDHVDYKWILPSEYKAHNLIPNLYNVFENYLANGCDKD